MQVFLYITILLLLAYGILIEYYRRSWNAIPDFDIGDSENPSTRITVIIPARNEEKNIGHCLRSLLNQTYDKALLEIIVVNDHSTDKTEEMVRNFNSPVIRLINLQEEPGILTAHKKKAIAIAVARASGELIVTTDADCSAPANWLKCMALLHQRRQAAFIAAPVKILQSRSLISVFQCLDFISLQGITGAAVHAGIHSMCNGANLAYEKNAFDAVGGFEGIDSIASGDDMLLMHKIYKKFPGRIFFLKTREAIVSTQPMESWKGFFNQRIRWASKADRYDDKRIFWTLLLVYLLNVCLLVFLVAACFHLYWLIAFLALITVKTMLEFAFVYSVARFFEQTRLMKYFFFLQPLHIGYTVIAGWMGKFASYEWKDRKIK